MKKFTYMHKIKISIIAFISILVFAFLYTPSLYVVSAQEDLGDTFNRESIYQENLNTPEESVSPLKPKEANAFFGTGKGSSILPSWVDVACGITTFLRVGECPLESGFWIQTMVINHMIANPTTNMWCEEDFQTTMDKGSCITSVPVTTVSHLNNDGSNFIDGKYVYSRVRGTSGLAMMANTLALVTDPRYSVPTDLALYTKMQFGDTIFGTPAYAQTPFGETFQNFILNGWRATRNISLALFGIVLSAVGVMIMVRHKVSPQVVASLYSVLPMIPVSLLVIIISYPFIAFAYSLISPLTGLAIKLGGSILGSSLNNPALTNAIAQNSLYPLFEAAVNGGIEAIAKMAISSLLIVFFIISMLWLFALMFLFAIFTMVKLFVSLIYTTVVSPFVGLMSIIPGNQGLISNLLKRIVVDVLSIPFFVLIVFIGFSVIAYTPTLAATPGLGDPLGEWFYNIASNMGVLLLYIVKNLMGIMIVFHARKARKSLEEIFGVQKLFAGLGGGEEKRR